MPLSQSSKSLSLTEFMQQWNNAAPFLSVRTSGSTGTPKTISVPKASMVASARKTIAFLQLHEGDSALLCMPLDFIAGKMMVVRSIVGNLNLIAVEPSSHPLAQLQPDTPPITFAAMTPMQVWDTIQQPNEERILRQVRHLIIGGGAISTPLAQRLADFPNFVWSTYGMTETLSHIAMRRINGPEASDAYIPLSGVSLGSDSRGCLTINAPDIVPHELVTNDVVQWVPSPSKASTSAPHFRIVGRLDNVICSGGIKVQAEEVERILEPHISAPFMVSWFADDRLGQAVSLVVQTSAPQYEKPSAPSTHVFSEASLLELCRSLLPRYWVPKHILFVPQLPRTQTGKVRRNAFATLSFHAKKFKDLTIDELYALLHTRSQVFVVEQNDVYQDLDYDDQQAIHIWLSDDETQTAPRILAMARICPRATHLTEVSIGRVITTERSSGFGRFIMSHAIAIAQTEFDAKIIDIQAQQYAIGFYQKVGFQVTSDPFILDGIPHVDMRWQKETATL